MTLSSLLWENSKAEREEVLNSVLIHGIQNLDLDVTRFGAFMVQDSVHCWKIKEFVDIAAGKAHGQLKKFLQQRSMDYERYYKRLYEKWRIKDGNAINLNVDFQTYTDYKFLVATTMEPIYFIVAMIPCEKVWPWLGTQLQVTQRDFGVYTSWAREILDPFYDRYRELDSVIDQYAKIIDKYKAQEIYTTCMTGELKSFNSI